MKMGAAKRGISINIGLIFLELTYIYATWRSVTGSSLTSNNYTTVAKSFSLSVQKTGVAPLLLNLPLPLCDSVVHAIDFTDCCHNC